MPPPALTAVPSDKGSVRIPGYEVLGELGRGGMGVVYKARQVRANRLVALKMILVGGHAGQAEVQRFRTEAHALARLRHPNIVQVYAVSESEGRPYFSLEFCAGGSLDRKLGGTPLPPREAARLVETLARALQAAHEASVIHRDLKPANVLLTEDGTLKVTDFGLAKKLDETSDQTQSGAIMGTPSYMAPEQAEGKTKEIGPEADIYALGAILYECLTGRPPFRAATPLDTILQVVNEEPVPPRQLQSKVPRDLETICLKCLRKEPAARYDSAMSLAHDLGRYQRGEPIQARPVGRVERGWRWCRRNPSLAGSLVGVAASLLVGTVVATAFAVQANRARGEAEQRAGAEATAKERARAKKEAAVEARDDLAQANTQLTRSQARMLKTKDNLLTSIARHRLRSLAVGVEPGEALPPLRDPEVEALWDLAATPEEGLRLRFVEEALRTPVSTRQLRGRAEYALHAVVGLDRSRRAEVEALLGERLLAEGTSQQQEDVALCLAELGVVDRALARRTVAIFSQELSTTSELLRRSRLAGLTGVVGLLERREGAVVLTQAMSRTTDPDTLRSLAQALSQLAARTGPGEAAEVAAVLIQAIGRTTQRDQLQHLRQGLSAVVARLEPVAAAQACAQAARLLSQAMSKTTDRYWQKHLAESLAALAAPMEPREAAAHLVQVISRTTDPDTLQVLLPSLSAVVDRMEPREAAQVGGQAIGILTRASGKMTGPFGLARFSPSVSALSARMEPREAAALFSQAIRGATDADTLLYLSEALSALAARMESKEAAVVCGQAAGILTEVMRKPTSVSLSFFMENLSRGLSALAARMEPQEAARVCSQAAETLTQAITRVTEPHDRESLSRSLSLVAAHMEAREAVQVCRQVGGSFTRILLKTEDPSELESLSRCLSALARRMDPEGAAQTAASLTLAMNKVTARSALRSLIRAYDPTTQEYWDLLRREKSGLRSLTQAVAAVAAHLEPGEAARVCGQAADILIQAMGQPGRLFDPVVLSVCLSGLSAHLDPREAALLVIGFMRRPPRQVDLSDLMRMLEGLSAVVASMKAKDAGEIAVSLTEALSTTADPSIRVCLGLALCEVAARLEPAEAAQACARAAPALIEAMSKTEYPHTLRDLAQSLSAMAPHLGAGKAVEVCGQAAAVLAQGMSESPRLSSKELLEGLSSLTAHMEAQEAAALLGRLMRTLTNPSALQSLSRDLSLTAARLEPKEAAPVLVQAISRTTDPFALQALVPGLSAAVARLDAGDAAQVCAQAAGVLSQAISKARNPYALHYLPRSLSVVTARLEPREATRACGQAAATLIQAISQTTPPTDRSTLQQGLSAAVAGMEPREAARLLSQAIDRTTDSCRLEYLSKSLAAAAARMEPEEAARVCGQAASTLSLVIDRTTETAHLKSLWDGWLALLPRAEPKNAAALLSQAMRTDRLPLKSLLPCLLEVSARQEPPEAAEACGQAASLLLQAMSTAVSPHDSRSLSQDLSDLLAREGAAATRTRLRSVVALAAGLGGPSPPFAVLDAVPPALEPVLPPLPAQALVGLLKHPLCVGEARRLVLQQLTRHYGRPFADPWDFVEYAHEQKLSLDLTTPPQRLEVVPPAPR